MTNAIGDIGHVCRYQLNLLLNMFVARSLHIWLYRPVAISSIVLTYRTNDLGRPISLNPKYASFVVRY